VLIYNIKWKCEVVEEIKQKESHADGKERKENSD
jgi:hypothetical protein